MMNIYQLFPRLFGNKNQKNTPYGSINENGCGKFSDINPAALISLRELGITHIWLTGIIRHATLTDYSTYGIPKSHPSVVKGRAGSPYAIADYYDIDPDLAEEPANRMEEFTQLIGRIHGHGMKVLVDFVPNHLAREYKSVRQPDSEPDFGENDDKNLPFHQNNNFYYLPGKAFVPPLRPTDPLAALAKKPYREFPAHVTGNDCFTESPTINDWYETIKLNYGVDHFNYNRKHFDPVPDTWHKMLHVLQYWAKTGVDGFRTDMSEMVPIAFWKWLIGQLRNDFPDLTLVAEIYQPSLYQAFIEAGFDYLYDKVGLYNNLEQILYHGAPAETLSNCWKVLNLPSHHMLRFMENHDEPRLASPHFVGDPFAALPALAVSALMHTGPFMVYNGQESGEEAAGAPGYSGDDGRTSIFDYTHMPQHQQWMNNGQFDGGGFSDSQHKLRQFYQTLLNLRLNEKALAKGAFYDLMWANPWHSNFDPQNVYAFLRYFEDEVLAVAANFHRNESRSVQLKIPNDALIHTGMAKKKSSRWKALNLLNPDESHVFELEKINSSGIELHLKPGETTILKLQPY